MRSLLLVLLTAAALAALAALPTSAVAKGIAGVDVCGADGCSAVDAAHFHASLTDGKPLTAPVAAAPFVTVHVKWHEFVGGARVAPRTEAFTYLPSLGLVRRDGAAQWIELYPVRRGELAKLVSPIRPLPAAQLSGVGVEQPDSVPAKRDTTAGWTIAGGAAAICLLLGLLARYVTSALNARPRTSKSAN